jgi:radical SAM protein with 4Fe4S-binding SPASM domain
VINSCIPELGIQDYIQHLRSAGGIRLPLVGGLELTFRCNNRCAHCYVNKQGDDAEERHREMNCEQVCRMLDDLADTGCLWLVLTGGEPLIRQDFEDIYVYAKKKGFLITLFTNGTLITPTIADLFQRFPPRSIEITLYGLTKDTYEKVTLREGSYEECMQGIDLLSERKLPLGLKSVVTTLNKHEFTDIKKFVEADLGREFRFDALINPRIDGQRDVTRYRITPSEVVELDKTDPRRIADFHRLHDKASVISSNNLFVCGAGINSFHIDPYGRLSICNMVRAPSYDLTQGSFKEGWYDFLPSLREHECEEQNKCKDCRLRSMCNQCPGWSLLEHGDYETPTDYLCRVTHLRAEAFGIG